MASAMFVYRLTPDDGKPFVVGVGSRDVLAWERDKPGRAAAELSDKIAVGNAYWLAHRAAKRLGLYDGDRKRFEETHELEGATEKELAEFRGEAGEDDGDGGDPT